jgi:hypothetical protein
MNENMTPNSVFVEESGGETYEDLVNLSPDDDSD